MNGTDALHISTFIPIQGRYCERFSTRQNALMPVWAVQPCSSASAADTRLAQSPVIASDLRLSTVHWTGPAVPIGQGRAQRRPLLRTTRNSMGAWGEIYAPRTGDTPHGNFWQISRSPRKGPLGPPTILDYLRPPGGAFLGLLQHSPGHLGVDGPGRCSCQDLTGLLRRQHGAPRSPRHWLARARRPGGSGRP